MSEYQWRVNPPSHNPSGKTAWPFTKSYSPDVEAPIFDNPETTQSEPILEPTPEGDWRDDVIKNFSNWLRNLTREEFEGLDDDVFKDDIPDLMSFYGELAALKKEVNLQSKANQKSSGEMISQVSTIHDDLLRQSDLLSKAVTDVKSQVPEARRRAREDIVLELIELREALAETVAKVAAATLPNYPWLRKARTLLEECRRGPKLLLAKTDDALRRLDIEALTREGDVFDADTMKVVANVDNSGRAPGTVTAVFRQGYRMDGRILRTSEVEVEKQ